MQKLLNKIRDYVIYITGVGYSTAVGVSVLTNVILWLVVLIPMGLIIFFLLYTDTNKIITNYVKAYKSSNIMNVGSIDYTSSIASFSNKDIPYYYLEIVSGNHQLRILENSEILSIDKLTSLLGEMSLWPSKLAREAISRDYSNYRKKIIVTVTANYYQLELEGKNSKFYKIFLIKNDYKNNCTVVIETLIDNPQGKDTFKKTIFLEP